jgi:hypothetical protein
MADNNLARSRNDLPDFFADDDPLAELARIVVYDDLPASARAMQGASMPGRREPAFNLEDELLQEFERYDAPRLDPANDISIDDVPRRVIGSAPLLEPSFDQEEAAPVFRQAATAPAFDTPSEPSVSLAPSVDLERHAVQRQPDPIVHVEPIFDLPGASAVQAEEVVIDEFDLAAELESSFGVEPVLAPEPAVNQEPARQVEPRSKAYEPGFRMPLANFHLARSVPLAAVPPVERVQAEPARPAPEAVLEAAPAVPEAIAKPVVSPEASQPVQAISQPVSVVEDTPSDREEQIVAGAAPTFAKADIPAFQWPIAASRSEPMAVSPQPAVVAPSVQRPEPVQAVTSSSSEAAAVIGSSDLDDPFSDDDFEISLSDLELDLADFAIEDEAAEPVAVAAVEASWAQPAPQAVAAVEPVQIAEQPAEEPADLPFDPAEIAEAEEQVEAIAELDVPELPVEEPEQPPVYRPDYDIDIDAELASLMMEPEKKEPVAPPKPDVVPQPTVSFASYDRPAPVSQPPHYSDLDDFERALEEDFRRSLAAPLAPVERDEAYSSGTDYLSTFESARRSVKSWALPMVIAGVVVAGGFGAYAWIGSGVTGAGSTGEPVIIAADTDPVKVAPVNPGGKTVPNQDKAVYDRVAGVASQEPKQSTLISSNEEPVDVVQKTLMPDSLPLEGENDIEPTEVSDTQDQRLLPNQEQQAALPAEQQPVAVMPRKVKTMIVRPDGKLVEQEIVAPVAASPEMAKMPAAGTRSTEPTLRPGAASGAVAQIPAAAPTGIVPVSAPVSANMPTVNAAATKGGQVAPVAAAPQVAEPVAQAPAQPPASATARAPVPVTRPAEQPVNVVAAVTDQGTVRAPTAAQQPAQVASLGDGGYVIQIASLPSQADAQKSYQNLSSKFGSVIGGRGVDIKAAEVAGKGTFYRVRIPAGSKAEAVALCEKYRGAGGSCLVAR